MTSYNHLATRLASANQSHLLRFWDDLSNKEKDQFLTHLNTINYEETAELFQGVIQSINAGSNNAKLDSRMEPIPPAQFESEERSTPEQLEKYRRIGLEEISEGHVGVLLLAGGQGTRLGVPYPKGMYSIGLPSGKTLFQVQAERIRRVEELARRQTGRNNGHITWYIMTSGPTEETTQAFLKTNKYFGLDEQNIVQFEQGLLPCFDMDGKMLLESKNRVALAPDGNGGIYWALHQKGILADMEKRGIRCLHVHSVDNILVKVADPVFVGYCVAKQADCGAKVVRKADPAEAVGVVCQVDGRFHVVEYSEITEQTSKLRDDQGELIFNAGNICNHFFTTNFLIQVALKHEKKLKLHVAKKKIPFINENGEKEQPTKANGIKIEKFIFDVFQFSDNFVTWEVPRLTEFSALKNSNDAGKDCPVTALKDVFRLYKHYVEAAGGIVEGDVVEISPLLSYAGEDLSAIVKGKVFQAPVVLNAPQETIGNSNGHRPSDF